MKFDKKRILEIINEEYDMVYKHNHHSRGRQIDDKEGKMVRGQLQNIARYSIELHQMLEPYGDNLQLEGWVQKKLALAEDYISKVKHFLENELNIDPMREQ